MQLFPLILTADVNMTGLLLSVATEQAFIGNMGTIAVYRKTRIVIRVFCVATESCSLFSLE
jgi:hypothetical protein